MSEFHTRVARYLKPQKNGMGGDCYWADREHRTGLAGALAKSAHAEVTIEQTHLGTRVILAGGDDQPREFVIVFLLIGRTPKKRIVRHDIVPDSVRAVFRQDWETGRIDRVLYMTRHSAAQLYNLAADWFTVSD